MGFMDSYKRLEKLCGEILNTDRPVKAYIEEMKSIPRGAYYVRGWNEDLDCLKHYLWVRNKISHDPGCCEENMCQPEDADWLDDFYLRIMEQNDPLTLYRKAMQPKMLPKQMCSQAEEEYTTPLSSYQRPNKKAYLKTKTYVIGAFVCIEILAIFAILIMLVYFS